MRSRSTIIGILLAGIALAGTGLSAPTAAAQGRRGFEPLLAALNDCIQERFKDVDEGFGFRRLVRIGDTPHRFRPENAREMTAVGALERSGLQVVLYLAGRRVLQPIADPADFEAIIGRLMIKGPARVTSADATPPEPPSGLDLWTESRRAMASFERADSHEFTLRDWAFTARPVRAISRACLRCHIADGSATPWPKSSPAGDLRVGDALGVILYGVQK
jgi:hypothetical protein